MKRSPERGYAFKVKNKVLRKIRVKLAVCLCETARLYYYED